MGLFGFGKKKEKVEAVAEVSSAVKVLGGGCANCNKLEESTKQALIALNMDDSIEHVRDMAKIASLGVMVTPALVIDGKVVSSGKVLKTDEVIELIKKVRG